MGGPGRAGPVVQVHRGQALQPMIVFADVVRQPLVGRSETVKIPAPSTCSSCSQLSSRTDSRFSIILLDRLDLFMPRCGAFGVPKGLDADALRNVLRHGVIFGSALSGGRGAGRGAWSNFRGGSCSIGPGPVGPLASWTRVHPRAQVRTVSADEVMQLLPREVLSGQESEARGYAPPTRSISAWLSSRTVSRFRIIL